MRISLLIALAALLTLGTGVAVASHNFTDVPDDHTFHADISWAADNGLIQGCNPPDNTRACPNDSLTRGQAAAMFHRFARNVTPEEGPQGPPGPPGADGEDGADGADGEDGEGLMEAPWECGDPTEGQDHFHNPDQCESFVQELRTGAMNVAGSDADDVTEGEHEGWEFYRVQTRDANGDEFDVRDAHTVLWLEDGTLHNLTDPDGAEALYFNRNEDVHTGEVRIFYRLDDGNWLTITATFNDAGELLTVNGDEYDFD